MTQAEKQHKAALVSIGCVLCRHLWGITDTPPQLHHLRSGGWGRGDYKTLIPLCPTHHVGDEGVHGMGTKAFERYHGITQRELLDMALELVK